MSKLADIIKKIKALQAKARDSATTEAEQMAFAAKVSELLIKHSLDPSVLDDIKQDEILVSTEMYPRNYTHPWRPVLAKSVAQLYFCKILLITTERTTEYTNAKKRMLFIGKPHNRAIAISMFEHFENTIKRMATDRYSGRGDIATFERGCGLWLANRIDEYYHSLQRPSPAGDRSVPILYQTEEKAVQVVYEGYNPRTGKSLNLGTNSAALWAGMQAAKDIHIGGQVTHTMREGIRLLK